MSLVRSLGRLKFLASTLHQSRKLPAQIQSVRHAAITYRGQGAKEPKVYHYLGEALSFFLWYWILYHCYYEFEHLVPSHDLPDPKKLTNEELGIPPDDED